MNLFQKVKALLAINKAYNDIKENYKMNPIKPGWKTTEFLMTVATVGTTLVGALKGIIPENYATAAIALLTAVYTICRSFTKAISPVVNATAAIIK